MSDEGLKDELGAGDTMGHDVIDYIISANLLSARDGVCVWTANAPSQIGAFIEDGHRKG